MKDILQYCSKELKKKLQKRFEKIVGRNFFNNSAERNSEETDGEALEGTPERLLNKFLKELLEIFPDEFHIELLEAFTKELLEEILDIFPTELKKRLESPKALLEKVMEKFSMQLWFTEDFILKSPN